MKKIRFRTCTALAVYHFFQSGMQAAASEGEDGTGEYTTIRINAEDDSGEPLQYAIDSDAPEAFGSSNEFTVERGSEHTVYVKDPAGNISAQVYRVPDADVDLEVNIGYSDTSSASMVTDERREAPEKGGGTLAERVETDGGSNSERLFYTVETKEGHVFYLVVDRNGGTDNVYLLDQVTDGDLRALAADGGTGEDEEDAGSIFDAMESTQGENPQGTERESTGDGKKGGGGLITVILLGLLAAAAFYYYKIYKPKQGKRKDISDAMDLDEFEPEDAGEGGNDVLDFAVSREEREAELEKIMNGNDFGEEPDFLDYDPEEDAAEPEGPGYGMEGEEPETAATDGVPEEDGMPGWEGETVEELELDEGEEDE